MKLGELLQMLEGYNPETEVRIVLGTTVGSEGGCYPALGTTVGEWGKYIDIYADVIPFEENEE
jgi:hypothetical protein